MNLPNEITPTALSSQTQQPEPPNNSISIESIELSIQNLTKSFNRRLEWQHFFNPKQQNLHIAPWRNKLVIFLESTTVHALTISLLILDFVLTLLELSSSLLSCGPKKESLQQVWFHWVGFGILALLSAKTVALAAGLGGAFVRRPGYVVDAAVVVGALFLETFLEKMGGGLLVVVSLWRVVRVVESALELSDEAIEAQIEGIVCQFEQLRGENLKLKEVIVEKDTIIEKLQEELQVQCRHICDNPLE